MDLVKVKARKAITVRVARREGAEARYAVSLQGQAGQDMVPLSGIPGQVEKIRSVVPACFGTVHDLIITDLQEKEIFLGSTPYFLEKCRIELVIGKTVK